ncbi:hypothetical protein N0V90_002060 [Kalmusia sp. IMI 367209]|nr:hypothetical protein N0V90_002060 [Kalmusia sp. IMI 367209]
MPTPANSSTRRNASLAQSPGFVGAAARFWQRSYASDYVGLAILIAGWIVIQLLGEPFHRMFSLDNLSIQYPHADVERVSVTWLFIYAGAVPLGTLIVWALVVRPGAHKSHVTILGWFISLILTLFITDLIKNAVGKTTTRSHRTLQARARDTRSPARHSSFAFSGLGYLALFLAGQCHVFRPRTDLARVLLALAPLLGAALIAISRCEDYRHDVYDVSTGSLLGILVAYYTYRRYYPPLRNSKCATPYPNPADSIVGFSKLKDEEQRISGVGEYELDDIEEGDEEGGK